MQYVRTLKEIHRADRDLVGERATDLAVLSEHDFSTPLSFVLTNDAFEHFILQNKLRDRIALALQGADPNRIYERIRELILNTPVPQEIVAEIVEAYESLSIDENESLNGMVKSKDAPYVTVILSPNHTVPSESKEGIILNVRGLEELLIALQECWACLFTPGLQRHRQAAGVTNRNLNVGVIIQQMCRGDVSAEAWSATGSDPTKLTVQSYYGALDIGIGVEKDEFRLNRDYLKPVYQSVGIQTQLLARDETGKLGKVPLGPRGEEQKLNDRVMIELGRLTKKASQVLDSQVTLLFNVQDETIKTLLATRLLLTKGSVKLQAYEEEERIEEAEASGERKVVEEVEESLVVVDGKSEVIAQSVEKVELSEESSDAGRVSDERAEPVVEETPEPGVPETPPDEPAGEPLADETEEEPDDSEVEAAEHELNDSEVEAAEDEPDDSEAEAAEHELAEESIFASVEVSEDESEAPVIESTTATPDAATDATEVPDETDAEMAAERPSPAEEEPDERTEGEESSVEVETAAGEVSAEREGTVRETTRTLEEAYALIKDALVARYERRFRNPSPGNMKELFFELSSEVIIPHEELIGRLVKAFEDGEGYDQELEERVLAILDDFLEQLR